MATSDIPIRMASGNKNVRIPGLDGLRAISIGLVLAGHLAGTRYCYSTSLFSYVGDVPNLGVRIFFIISGYLITTLLLNEYNRTGTISLKGFYARRTLRIFPAFYCFLVVVATLYAIGLISLRPGDLSHAFTYTINYHYDRAWWLGHIWSLSVEEQFYLLWPAVLLVLGIQRGLKAALAVVIAAPLFRIGIVYFLPTYAIGIGESFPTICDTIALGCLLARYNDWLQLQSWYRRLLESKWFALVPLLAFVLNLHGGGRIRYLLLETVINLCIALCISRCVAISDDVVGRVLDSRPFIFVGTLSYSLYLWQQLFLNRESSAWSATFPLNLVLAVGAAMACHYLVEKPFLALRNRSRRSKRAVGGSIEKAPTAILHDGNPMLSGDGLERIQ